MVGIPAELSPDPHERYDAAAGKVLYPVAGLVGLLYLVLAALHPVMVGGRGGLIMSAAAGLTAVVLLAVALWARNRSVIPHGTALLAAVILAMIFNSGLHLWITGEDWQTTNLMLVVIGAGMAVLATRWNLVLTALCWVAWVIGMINIPGVNWPHWFIAMGMATLVGQLVRFGRRNNLDTAANAVEIQVGLLGDAEELAESRQNLLATISHDVRTPVTGIVGMVDLLLQRPLDARTRELVVGVRHSADGLTTMLNNLLDLARVEAGKLEVHETDSDVCDMVSEVLQMVGPMAQAKRIPLIGAASPDLHGEVHRRGRRHRCQPPGQLQQSAVGPDQCHRHRSGYESAGTGGGLRLVRPRGPGGPQGTRWLRLGAGHRPAPHQCAWRIPAVDQHPGRRHHVPRFAAGRPA